MWLFDLYHSQQPENAIIPRIIDFNFFLLLFLSVSPLGSKAFCIIMSFLVLRSISWSSSLVHFRNGSECLSLWWDFCYVVWLRVIFSISYYILLIFFFYLHLFDRVPFQYTQVLVSFLFSDRPDFSWSGSSMLFEYYYYYYYYYYYSPLRFFQLSVSWWLFTGFRWTASLLKSPGLFSIFWHIPVMQ